ncbi:MAG: hypothetical protein DRO36_06550 [Candidatus Hecatellales archaeon]|nr:MAG: hypothetical protein DRO36_06550 [Candidatus Hecatellales archaeon]
MLKKLLFVVFGVALLVPQIALADGMVVPPKDYWIQETDQKAVIFYDKGIETLVLSITFRGDAEDFGWVVPVPAKPEVSKGSDGLFTSLQELTGYTRAYLEAPVFGLGAAGDYEEKSVTIIETKKVDYYEVTVLSSTDKDALTEWLNDNGYDFPSSASYILDSYIQNGWYFVAMKINPQSLDWKDVSQQLREGHATPVAISFATKNIVYPLKISSVMSQTTSSQTTNSNANTNTSTTTNTNTSTTGGGVPTYTTGRIGKGIEISSNEIFSFSANSAFNTKEGTIEMWLKPTSGWVSSGSGYRELLNVVNSQGNDVFELRRGKDATHDNLQFIAYDSSFTAWKTSDQQPLSWDSSQWYYVAATWSEDSSPQIYINGIAQTMEVSYSGASWSMSSATDGTLYIGQRGRYLGSYAARAVIDEVRISSQRKTVEEIGAAYSQVLSNRPFEAEDNTLFLAHFNGDLTEEKSGEQINYNEKIGQVRGDSTDRLAQVSVKRVPSYYRPDTVAITLYVFADHKKTLPGFNTNWANWVKKEDIKEMALDDQGNPWITPKESKYFLTKLSRNMKYSEMTEDLFLRQADDNKKVGEGVTDWDKIKKQIGPLLIASLIYFAIVFLGSLFSPFGVLFIIGALLQFLSKNRTVRAIFWVLQGIAVLLYIATVIILLFVPIFGESVWEAMGGIPLYSVSTDLRQTIGFIIAFTPVLVVVAMMIIVMFLQVRYQRKKRSMTSVPSSPKPVKKIANNNN